MQFQVVWLIPRQKRNDILFESFHMHLDPECRLLCIFQLLRAALLCEGIPDDPQRPGHRTNPSHLFRAPSSLVVQQQSFLQEHPILDPTARRKIRSPKALKSCLEYCL